MTLPRRSPDSRPRQVSPSAATTLLHRPITTWFAEWKAQKSATPPEAAAPRPNGRVKAVRTR